MSIKVQNQDDRTLVAIKGEMTIYTALEQKNEFLLFLKNDSELQIDLSGVSEIDSAGLQLLLLLKQESSKRNIKLILSNHSQAVVEIFELLNLTAHFGDPIVLSANW